MVGVLDHPPVPEAGKDLEVCAGAGGGCGACRWFRWRGPGSRAARGPACGWLLAGAGLVGSWSAAPRCGTAPARTAPTPGHSRGLRAPRRWPAHRWKSGSQPGPAPLRSSSRPRMVRRRPGSAMRGRGCARRSRARTSRCCRCTSCAAARGGSWRRRRRARPPQSCPTRSTGWARASISAASQSRYAVGVTRHPGGMGAPKPSRDSRTTSRAPSASTSGSQMPAVSGLPCTSTTVTTWPCLPLAWPTGRSGAAAARQRRAGRQSRRAGSAAPA